MRTRTATKSPGATGGDIFEGNGMKVEIDEKGVLTIKPETGLESYALSKWNESWGDGGTSVLLVELAHPHTPGAKTIATVEPI